MPYSSYDTEKILKLRKKFMDVCNIEGGEVIRKDDGNIICQLGSNKITLHHFSDWITIERDIFDGEPQVSVELYGLNEITTRIDEEPIAIFVGEKKEVGKEEPEKWVMIIRYGKIYFSSGGITGNLKYPRTKPHQFFR